MKNVREFIDSGILESYVMGIATQEEVQEVEAMQLVSEEIKTELNGIAAALEGYAVAHALAPNPTTRPFVMATIDFTERMQAGEAPSFPRVLDETSKVSDYAEWLDRPDMQLPADFKDYHAKIISFSPELLAAIVWINDMAPVEVHDDQYEKFLVVEGTCDIVVEDNVHRLVPGDVLSIPLHKDHYVKVTSEIPCKVILQRVAA